MEAWRRQLTEPVSAFPVLKAGPANEVGFDAAMQTLKRLGLS